ncbi:Asp/Glu/hydantoin racemase [Tsukamurella pulmonis]|uniref:Asp/Glu/hydantoin racemase n=2 Tax=Tsukamurella pulmonis TaxID=47312 RepID=A0A1H1GWB6_9ACTN|nr:Asp/Glu/hydantoin racemase [Tsukamurella pulmonis]SUP16472.1 Hydantoin racemase [Tsukamurella pulmonis]
MALTAAACGSGEDAVVSGSSTAQAPAMIVLINPNSSVSATDSMVALARSEVGGAATIVGVTNEGAPALLTTQQDMVTAAQGVLRRGVAAAKEPGVRAIVVAAFSDPGLAELSSAVSIPVFGIGAEAFREAAQGGRAFGIATVTSDPALVESFRQKADELGVGSQYRGVRVTPGDATRLVADPDALDAALRDAVRASVAQDGAAAVIMGGGPLSPSALRLQPATDVPLIVAVNAAMRSAVREIG